MDRTLQSPSPTASPRSRTVMGYDRLKQQAHDQNLEAYRRCEHMITQFITHGEREGWAGLI